MIPLRGQIENRQNPASFAFRLTILRFQFYAGPFGQKPQGVREFQAFGFSYERENIAAFVAAEAVPDSFLRADYKRRRLLLMKRTPGFPALSGFLKLGHVFADKVDNINPLLNLVGDGGHKMAERAGFEPAVPCGTHAFQACALDQLCDLSMFFFDTHHFNKNRRKWKGDGESCLVKTPSPF